jgi:ribonuclease Z
LDTDFREAARGRAVAVRFDFVFDLVAIVRAPRDWAALPRKPRADDSTSAEFRTNGVVAAGLYLRAVSLSLRFLGTSASRPTVERGVSSIAVVREGETFLFDCGEGTQRQMMRYGVAFGLRDIFFSHMHIDHMLGVVGLMRTMALQGREEPLRVWGPIGSTKVLRRAEALGADRVAFPVEYRELSPGEAVRRTGYAIVAFAANHLRAPSLGFALVEDLRLGRFNPEIARELGIPEGPLWGRLHRGIAVTLDDGREVDPAQLVGPTRPGRKVVITGDTRPCDATVDAAAGADVLVHEATFATEEAQRAAETGHSTAREAAEVAARAGVRRLLLTHISARYSRDVTELEREAREVFPATQVARDGTEVDVPFPDELALPPGTVVAADGGVVGPERRSQDAE